MWFAVVLLLQAPVPATAAIPETLPKESIPAYQRLSPTLAIGGQPSPEVVARLRELGFETVINLRAASESGVAAEEEALRAAGLRYVWIPVTAETLNWDSARLLRAVLAEYGATRTLLHCSSSNRVGALLALIEGEQGADAATALERGRALGLQPGKTTEVVARLLETRCSGGGC